MTMTNDLVQKISLVVLLFVIFLEVYAVSYATETKKAARQLGIAVPGYIKIFITIPVVASLVSFVIVVFIFISTFFYK